MADDIVSPLGLHEQLWGSHKEKQAFVWIGVEGTLGLSGNGIMHIKHLAPGNHHNSHYKK